MNFFERFLEEQIIMKDVFKVVNKHNYVQEIENRIREITKDLDLDKLGWGVDCDVKYNPRKKKVRITIRKRFDRTTIVLKDTIDMEEYGARNYLNDDGSLNHKAYDDEMEKVVEKFLSKYQIYLDQIQLFGAGLIITPSYIGEGKTLLAIKNPTVIFSTRDKHTIIKS
jgi:hypothetical protein